MLPSDQVTSSLERMSTASVATPRRDARSAIARWIAGLSPGIGVERAGSAGHVVVDVRDAAGIESVGPPVADGTDEDGAVTWATVPSPVERSSSVPQAAAQKPNATSATARR